MLQTLVLLTQHPSEPPKTPLWGNQEASSLLLCLQACHTQISWAVLLICSIYHLSLQRSLVLRPFSHFCIEAILGIVNSLKSTVTPATQPMQVLQVVQGAAKSVTHDLVEDRRGTCTTAYPEDIFRRQDLTRSQAA